MPFIALYDELRPVNCCKWVKINLFMRELCVPFMQFFHLIHKNVCDKTPPNDARISLALGVEPGDV